MIDPNARYKAGFAALTEKLGRVPDSRDKEWAELHEEYKRAWAPAVEPQRRRPGLEGSSAPAATGDALGGEGEVTSRPGIIPTPDRDQTTPDPSSAAPRINSGAMVASEGETVPARGPNGGVLAQCAECGQRWERPKQRGRPALRCLQCRTIRA